MTTLGSPLSLEVASFEVVDYLDADSKVSCSTSSAMATLDASRVMSMTPVLVRSMMTPHTMVSSTTLVDALAWIEATSSFIAATLASSSSSAFFFY